MMKGEVGEVRKTRKINLTSTTNRVHVCYFLIHIQISDMMSVVLACDGQNLVYMIIFMSLLLHLVGLSCYFVVAAGM